MRGGGAPCPRGLSPPVPPPPPSPDLRRLCPSPSLRLDLLALLSLLAPPDLLRYHCSPPLSLRPRLPMPISPPPPACPSPHIFRPYAARPSASPPPRRRFGPSRGAPPQPLPPAPAPPHSVSLPSDFHLAASVPPPCVSGPSARASTTRAASALPPTTRPAPLVWPLSPCACTPCTF